MGGGGGGRFDPADINRFEELAKKHLTDAGGSERHNVFISFAIEDQDEVNLLRGQAKNEHSDIEFNDWSVKKPFNSEQAEYIRRRIRERIRQSSVTVVYLSESSAKSDWVDWEVRESLRQDKRVIATHKGENRPSSLPKAVSEYKIAVVPWSRLAETIRRQ